MYRARKSFIDACGSPSSSSFRSYPPGAMATIDGVGFFDAIHGQRGIAPNGIELHPLLRFRATGC